MSGAGLLALIQQNRALPAKLALATSSISMITAAGLIPCRRDGAGGSGALMRVGFSSRSRQ